MLSTLMTDLLYLCCCRLYPWLRKIGTVYPCLYFPDCFAKRRPPGDVVTSHNLSCFIRRRAGKFPFHSHSPPCLQRTPGVTILDTDNCHFAWHLAEQLRIVSLILMRIAAHHCRMPSFFDQLFKK